jgi:hypothetical protein
MGISRFAPKLKKHVFLFNMSNSKRYLLMSTVMFFITY